jgi:hypothetical protein
MSKTLKINGATVVPVHNIRTIRPITDDERAKMAEKYGKPVAEFKTKQITIQFADKSSKTADISLDQVREQGVGLVNTGNDRYVPAANIKSAEAFSKADAEKLKADGDYTLSQTFRSRVETTAGTLLSTATAQQVIERAAKALETSGSSNSTQGSVAKGPKAPAHG